MFVCAMWITGFDVPSIGTVYLDKPMKNHTLMQTIARANRRAPGKTAGVIVDYVGVFQNLQKALAIYAGGTGAKRHGPIKNKDGAGRGSLEEALAEARTFVGRMRALTWTRSDWPVRRGFARLMLIGDAVEALIAPGRTPAAVSLRLAGDRRPSLQGPAAGRPRRALYLKPVAVTMHVLAEAIRDASWGSVDISAVSAKIEALLDEKVEGVAITDADHSEGDEPGWRPGRPVRHRLREAREALFESKPKIAQRPRSCAACGGEPRHGQRVAAEAQPHARPPGREASRRWLTSLCQRRLDRRAGDSSSALKKLIALWTTRKTGRSWKSLRRRSWRSSTCSTKPGAEADQGAGGRGQEGSARELLEKLREDLDAVDAHWPRNQQTRAAVHSEIRFKLQRATRGAVSAELVGREGRGGVAVRLPPSLQPARSRRNGSLTS